MGFFDFLFRKGLRAKKDGSQKEDENSAKRDNRADLSSEYSAELEAEGLKEPPPRNTDLSHSEQGVTLFRDRKGVNVIYEGVLAKNGANSITAVVGYGNSLRWEDINEHPMKKSEYGYFELNLPVTRAGNINMAFKDEKGNWDNNRGLNYSFINEYYEESGV